jgi:N-acetylmuramic acid 6-phosphate etherase
VNRAGVRVPSPTEQVDSRITQIDAIPSLDLVRLLNHEDRRVGDAVAAVLPMLAELVDAAAARVSAGGRVHYFGAGTSGRLGVLDAAELMPTFGVGDSVVVAHLAGGVGAFLHAEENAEDDEGGLDAIGIAGIDVVVGLTASGRTPYVGAALSAARAVGALSALITSNPNALLARLADYVLMRDTGPEAITGSTRLKAGTAQKMVLNTFSTALMVRLGHTYGNMMVDMQPTNAKLRGRAAEMLGQASGASEAECAEALDLCGDVKTALVYLLTRSASPERCREALAESAGSVRHALALLASP